MVIRVCEDLIDHDEKKTIEDALMAIRVCKDLIDHDEVLVTSLA